MDTLEHNPAPAPRLPAAPSGSPGGAPLRCFSIAQRWGGTEGGGAERVVGELGSCLAQHGIAFTGFVTGSEDLRQRSGGRYRAFAREDAGMFSRLWGARSVVGTALQQEKPDLLASHFAFYTFPLLDRFGTIPHVVHFHGPWAAESRAEGGSPLAGSAKRALEQRVYASAARVIVLSRAFEELAVREYGIAAEKLRVIPGSVDIARFAVGATRREARSLLGWPLDRPILVTVRRLVSRVGLEALIEAVRAVRSRVPEVLLYIAGRGRLREALQARVREAALEEHVRFLGFVPDEQLPLIYRAADLNVVPTQALEGFGLVAAEAMAAGTPSLVTPVGGLPEVVAGVSPDLVFRSSSVFDLAAGLTAALRGELRLPEEQRLRAYVAEHFNSGLMAQRTAAVYREAVREAPAGARPSPRAIRLPQVIR